MTGDQANIDPANIDPTNIDPSPVDPSAIDPSPVDEADPETGTTTAIRVTGDFSRSTSTILATSMTLTATVGMIGDDDDRVLVPFVDCWCRGEFGPEDETQYHTIRLSLDNLAFVVERLSGALQVDVAPYLCAMSTRDLRPLPERTRYSIELLEQAAASLADATAQLRMMLDDDPAVTADE